MTETSILIAQADPRAGWFALHNGVQRGPVSLDVLRDDYRHGRLLPTDWLWTQSLPKWVRVAEVLGQPPPATSPAAQRPQARQHTKPSERHAEEPDRPQQRSRARKVLAAFYSLLALAVVSLSLASCYQFLAEGNLAMQTFAAGTEDKANALTLTMQIVETDLAHEQMKLHVTPRVTGALAQGSPRLPARDIELTLASVSGPMVLNLKRGHHIEPFDVTIALSDGDILLYPVDSYQGWIEAEALMAGTDANDPSRTSVVIEFNPRNHAVHVVPRLGNVSEHGDAVVQLAINRHVPIVIFTWFIAGVAAVIAIAVGLTVLSILTGRREADQGILSWTAGLLFALPAVRTSLPGSPPLGALIDYSVFFWAEALVGVSLIVLVMVLFGARTKTSKAP